VLTLLWSEALLGDPDRDEVFGPAVAGGNTVDALRV
jgi:hypothetical protein